MSDTRKDQIVALLKSIETGDPGPIAVVDQDRYIQHNPQTHAGSAGLEELFKRLSLTNPKIRALRVFEDGDYVFAHMEYDFSSVKICIEVFRFEGDKTVEHWDNIQPLEGPNPSGHDMISGPTEATDLDKTEDNRAHVRAFIEDAMIGAQPDLMDQFIDFGVYVDHSPQSYDDLRGLKAALIPHGSDPARLDYQTLHRVLAEGSFALAVTEGVRAGVHTSFYDLFRLENGLIVEHWDTVEPVAGPETWKNENGKF